MALAAGVPIAKVRRSPRCPPVVPAQARTHRSAARSLARWTPASPGMTTIMASREPYEALV